MDNTTLIHKEISRYLPAVWLERVFGRSARSRVRTFAGLILGIAAAFWALAAVSTYSSQFMQLIGQAGIPLSGLWVYSDVAAGITAAAGALWLAVTALEMYFRWWYLRFQERDDEAAYGISYSVAAVIASGTREDLTSSLCAHRIGAELMRRLGIETDDVINFLRNRGQSLPVESIEPLEEVVDIERLAEMIHTHDESFADFLFEHGVQKNTFTAAAVWIQQRIDQDKKQMSWWSRRRLGRISPLGREWSYGEVYTLKKYATNMRSLGSAAGGRREYARDRVQQLEEVLRKNADANAFLVGETGVGKIDIIRELYRQLKAGTMLPPLADKRLVMLNADQLIAATGDKTRLQRELQNVFAQAEHAGNIILVIRDFPHFIQSAADAGVNVASIIEPYLRSVNLQVIGTADPSGYHRVMEPQASLMRHFDTIQLETPDTRGSIPILQQKALQQETQPGPDVFFLYQAIEAIAEGADQYLVEGTMPDKAIDLLVSVTAHARENGIEVIDEEVVMEVIQQRTGVSVGSVDEKEQELLENLEEILHERVIGQDQAVSSIANAVRNARAGVRDTDRPIGTFMFFGPTGVGKTETTKALADAYFGGEEKIQRIDCSEFSSAESVGRLIGTGGANTAGVLANTVRQQPYGVLLLDEFEKAHSRVHDVFLQVLDEGYFTDGRGNEVNLRNMIIIATSNAGSDIIFEKAKEGSDISEAHDEVVDTLIQRGTFRPELLNRFDGLILFSPLEKDELEQIARLQLGRLQERVRQKGYRLEITEPLVRLVVEKGYEPQFGARAMQRVISEEIEQLIADKIISQEIDKGDTIRFQKAELPFS